MWWIAGLLATLVITGSLLAPFPKRLRSWRGKVSFWRRDSIRRRVKERHTLLVVYISLAAVGAIVMLVWIVPSLLTEHPSIANPADRHKAIADARTGLVALLAGI